MKRQHVRTITEAFRGLELWVAVAMFLVVVPLHYPQQVLPFLDIKDPDSLLGLERHPVERVFLLLPITYVGFLMGIRAGLAASALALAMMLPRALVISEHRPDALVEVAGVIVAGVVINVGFERIRRERERRRLIAEQLRLSEERYRRIFENAHDAIWVQDPTGRIVVANGACAQITGYGPDELIGMMARDFLPEETAGAATQVMGRLLAGETFDRPFELEIVRRDGARTRLWLTASLITIDGGSRALQLIARDVTEQARLRENLQFYLQQVTRAQEHERERIARELHDETAQSLLLIAQRLDRIGSSPHQDGAPQLAEEMERLRAEALQTLGNLRRLTQDLRPRILDDLGLVAALEWLVDDQRNQFSVETRVDVDENLPELSQETQLLLFRIAQEALRNTGRHSGAGRATISLGRRGDRLKMTLTDDGRGFEPPKNISDLAAQGKLGLLGMYERARLLGGTFDIRSSPGQGTTVEVQLPMADVFAAPPQYASHAGDPSRAQSR